MVDTSFSSQRLIQRDMSENISSTEGSNFWVEVPIRKEERIFLEKRRKRLNQRGKIIVFHRWSSLPSKYWSSSSINAGLVNQVCFEAHYFTCSSRSNTKSKQRTDINVRINTSKFPIPLPDDKELYEKFSGKYIGIIKGKIFTVAEDRQTLKDNMEKFLKKGQRCRIRYIENRAIIWG